MVTGNRRNQSPWGQPADISAMPKLDPSDTIPHKTTKPCWFGVDGVSMLGRERMRRRVAGLFGPTERRGPILRFISGSIVSILFDVSE